LGDKRGNVAVMTALCLPTLAIAAGVAIDFNNVARVRLTLQDATDTAALAIARNASTITDGELQAAANNYIAASYNGDESVSVTPALDRQTMTVTLTSRTSVNTLFSGVLRVNTVPVAVTSVVKGQNFDYEIVMALDNSGSMSASLGQGSTKIAELKKASTALLDAMMTPATSGHVKIGIVPFAASVKVGSGYSAASWMDTNGDGYTAEENFDSTNTRRLNLYDPTKGMKGVSWAGCVESRPTKVSGTTVDYDANDAVPTTLKPDTLFEPWFAPDEPDGDNGSFDMGTYTNNYLDDEGGGCTGTDTTIVTTDLIKQRRSCKYKGVTPNTSGGRGPNYMCTTTAITPLTATRATLDSAVTAMAANGTTNILEGMAWAWRVLSPTEPFTQGAAYGTENLNKVVILMSDGENNYPGASNINNSDYFSYAYSAQGRVGSTSSNTSTLITKLDDRTKLACDNAKAKGVIIYTVALGASANKTLMAYCASETSYAYTPTNGADLTPVFQAIAASINKLRIAQ
jgi:Flp pilus assembly protein TadG